MKAEREREKERERGREESREGERENKIERIEERDGQTKGGRGRYVKLDELLVWNLSRWV